MSNLHYEDQPKASKLPIATLTLRVTTLVTLAISMGLLRSNSVTYNRGQGRETFTFNAVKSYEYVFFGTIVGFCYTLLQLPFSLYFFLRKKRLTNNNGFLMFELYGDKICAILLATAVGTLFGATVQTKDGAQNIKLFGGFGKDYDAKDYRSKMRQYCMLANISAVFLLVGCFSSVISSIISSTALQTSGDLTSVT